MRPISSMVDDKQKYFWINSIATFEERSGNAFKWGPSSTYANIWFHCGVKSQAVIQVDTVQVGAWGEEK